jgi:hypothetical protein
MIVRTRVDGMIKALRRLLDLTTLQVCPSGRKVGEPHTALAGVSLPLGEYRGRIPRCSAQVSAECINPRQLSRTSRPCELFGIGGITIE